MRHFYGYRKKYPNKMNEIVDFYLACFDNYDILRMASFHISGIWVLLVIQGILHTFFTTMKDSHPQSWFHLNWLLSIGM